MRKKDKLTPVKFSKFPDGDIVALFPLEEWNRSLKPSDKHIASYQHIGQHGGASVELLTELEECKPHEYHGLLCELTGIGYDNLVIINHDALDAFTRSYIECALWCEDVDGCTQGKDISDIHPASLARMAVDCANFQIENKLLIKRCGLLHPASGNAQHGHDFWLTRNGHGAGFWDRGYIPRIGEGLTDAAQAYGDSYMILGDDGMLYCE